MGPRFDDRGLVMRAMRQEGTIRIAQGDCSRAASGSMNKACATAVSGESGR